MNDLTGFKRDLLRGIASLGETNGLDLLSHLEDVQGYQEIHHGRLYPNLDDLVRIGLVRKDEADGRTNAYSLTPRGRREVIEWGETWGGVADSLRRDDGGGSP